MTRLLTLLLLASAAAGCLQTTRAARIQEAEQRTQRILDDYDSGIEAREERGRRRELERMAAIKEQPEAVRADLLARTIRVGYTREQAILALGEPHGRLTTSRGTEQLSYRWTGLTMYVYIRAGKVSNWQRHEH